MRLFVLFAVLLASCSNGQSGILGTVVNRPILIIQGFESNSGGRGLNADATTAELAPRGVKILNNTSLQFEPLDIGTNNLIGHAELESVSTLEHSIELQIANEQDSGAFYGRPVYIVKAGQGGSEIANWSDGGAYYTTFQERTTAAITYLTELYGVGPQVFIFYSQGINDAIAGTDISTWKAATIAHINNLRSDLGATVPVVMTLFESPMTERAAINTAITEIATEVSGVYTVSSAGVPVRDENHWSYAGLKIVGRRFIDVLQANYLE